MAEFAPMNLESSDKNAPTVANLYLCTNITVLWYLKTCVPLSFYFLN